MGKFRDFIDRIRSPTADGKTVSRVQMVTISGNGIAAWNGKLYQSDIIRACIRPKANAIGKMVMHHIRDTADGRAIDPEPYLKFLLTEPNPYMTGQKLLERLITTKEVSGNAFALILRDENGRPCEIYPVPAVYAEAIVDRGGNLFLKFTFRNGKTGTFPYSDIIHLRRDFAENDIFGASPFSSLAPVMEVVHAADQSVIHAVKNSAIIRWLMKVSQPLRGEDLKLKAKEFSEAFLTVDAAETGVAVTDSKADVTQIKPEDYVPNAAVTDRLVKRVQSFYGTNDKIVNASYTENEWIAYYESEVEPDVIQISEEFSRKIFTRRERARGNGILCEAASLQYASMTTKLQLVQYVDRGIMTPNELRALMALAPIAGGDVVIRRLDTAPVYQSDEDSGESSGEGGEKEE